MQGFDVQDLPPSVKRKIRADIQLQIPFDFLMSRYSKQYAPHCQALMVVCFPAVVYSFQVNRPVWVPLEVLKDTRVWQVGGLLNKRWLVYLQQDLLF